MELHYWTGSAVTSTAHPSNTPPKYLPGSGPDFDDWTWLTQHTTMRMH